MMGDLVERVGARAEHRRQVLAETLAGQRRAALPLRYWRQQAHFTTPAGNPAIARKAAEGGIAGAWRVLERFGIGVEEVAAVLGLQAEAVQRRKDGPLGAPLVLLDGEDAQAPRADVIERSRQSAAEVFRTAHWPAGTLRFYRPNGLDTAWTAADLAGTLIAAGPGAVDGVVFPKAGHPEELAWLDETLGEIEQALGVEERSIKVAFLVESGWGVRNLERMALAVLPRLSGLILGIADYSSDVGLSHIRNDHPVADWVRMEIVNLAGAVGVPAIDTMSFLYPVADPALPVEENRPRLLSRLRSVFDDAQHAISLGMSGKWVGHPAQLLATLLAFDTTLPQAEIDARVAEVEAYQRLVAAERGAAVHDGQMVDRATDRHAREVLRKAVVLGRLGVPRALALDVISAEEAAELGGD